MAQGRWALVAKAVNARKLKAIFVANRTYERAEELAREVGGTAMRFERIGDHLPLMHFAGAVMEGAEAEGYEMSTEEAISAGCTMCHNYWDNSKWYGSGGVFFTHEMAFTTAQYSAKPIKLCGACHVFKLPAMDDDGYPDESELQSLTYKFAVSREQ